MSRFEEGMALYEANQAAALRGRSSPAFNDAIAQAKREDAELLGRDLPSFNSGHRGRTEIALAEAIEQIGIQLPDAEYTALMKGIAKEGLRRGLYTLAPGATEANMPELRKLANDLYVRHIYGDQQQDAEMGPVLAGSGAGVQYRVVRRRLPRDTQVIGKGTELFRNPKLDTAWLESIVAARATDRVFSRADVKLMGLPPRSTWAQRKALYQAAEGILRERQHAELKAEQWQKHVQAERAEGDRRSLAEKAVISLGVGTSRVVTTAKALLASWEAHLKGLPKGDPFAQFLMDQVRKEETAMEMMTFLQPREGETLGGKILVSAAEMFPAMAIGTLLGHIGGMLAGAGALLGSTGSAANVLRTAVVAQRAFNIGRNTTAFAYWAGLEGRDIHKEVRASGMSKRGATIATVIAAPIVAAIELVQVKRLVPGWRKTVRERVIKSARREALKVLARTGRAYGREVGEEVLQEATKVVTRRMGLWLEQSGEMVQPTWREDFERTVEAGRQAAYGMVLFVGPGMVADVNTTVGNLRAMQERRGRISGLIGARLEEVGNAEKTFGILSTRNQHMRGLLDKWAERFEGEYKTRQAEWDRLEREQKARAEKEIARAPEGFRENLVRLREEAQRAEESRAEAEAYGEEEGLREGEDRGLRVRDVEEHGVAAEPGAPEAEGVEAGPPVEGQIRAEMVRALAPRLEVNPTLRAITKDFLSEGQIYAGAGYISDGRWALREETIPEGLREVWQQRVRTTPTDISQQVEEMITAAAEGAKPISLLAFEMGTDYRTDQPVPITAYLTNGDIVYEMDPAVYGYLVKNGYELLGDDDPQTGILLRHEGDERAGIVAPTYTRDETLSYSLDELHAAIEAANRTPPEVLPEPPPEEPPAGPPAPTGPPATTPVSGRPAAPAPPAGAPIAPGPPAAPRTARQTANRSLAANIKNRLTELMGSITAAVEAAEGEEPEVLGKAPPPGITSDELWGMADEAYAGTRGEGAYLSADAYDAMELGVNLWIKEQVADLAPAGDLAQAKAALAFLERAIALLPTQTIRSREKQDYQQFSTPPHYAYLAAWAANMAENDILLEPSAGVGGLAVYGFINGPEGARPRIVVNEISERRRGLLGELGFDKVLGHDAELIDNLLDEEDLPTVVLMNPPFSRAAARMGDNRIIGMGLQHVTAALKALREGGRLVAIVGAPLQGETTANYRIWLTLTMQKYTVRAAILVPRNVYKSYGTTFPTRLLVIDKIGPTKSVPATARNAPKQVTSLSDIADVLWKWGKRNDRAAIQQQPAPVEPGLRPAAPGQPGAGAGPRGGPGVPAPGEPDIVGVPGAPAVARPGAGEGVGPTRPGVAAPPGAGRPAGGPVVPVEPGAGRPGPERPGGVPELGVVPPPGRPGAGGAEELQAGAPVPGAEPVRPGEPGAEAGPVSRITIQAAERELQAEVTEDIFEPYRPTLTTEGAKAHPGSVVEPAALAAVALPPIDYVPNLPQELIASGAISDLQFEAVAYIGAAHNKMLEADSHGLSHRRGYMLGQRTGVGKTRVLCAAVLDQMRRGAVKKVLWLSESADLRFGVRNEWEALGQDPAALNLINKVKASKKIPYTGIVFSTYTTFAIGLGEVKPGKPKPAARLDQIVDWDPDFIVFDEAHRLANVLPKTGPMGKTRGSLQGIASVKLQRLLPNARVVYSTATAATDVRNYGYASRLGLWGPGTAFADQATFMSEIARGGLAAMEVLARDMKALGLYSAPQLAMNDGTPDGTVIYDTESCRHEFTPDQRRVYSQVAAGWQFVLQNIHAALKITGQAHSRQRSRINSMLWGAQLRIFNGLLTGFQLPTAIRSIEKDLAEDRSVVVQLTHTGEAAEQRALEKVRTDDDLYYVNTSPIADLILLIENIFPTQIWRPETDPDTGNVVWVNTQITSREAEQMKEALLTRLAKLDMPPHPLFEILAHFGVENVAEVTGRSQRLIEERLPDGSVRRHVEKRPAGIKVAEVASFMDLRKRILIASHAGLTGRDYHAALDAKNQQQRAHYMMEMGFSLIEALQGLGRTHRSNQRVAPLYRLVSTDLPGHKRFISTIAHRLAGFGALTAGQREAGGTQLFSPADDLESVYATNALRNLFEDLAHGRVEGMGIDDFERMTMLKITSTTGAVLANLPKMTQFLNRILALDIPYQNLIFDQFMAHVVTNIEAAQADGSFDRGIEVLKAERVQKVEDAVVYTHAETGAETHYVRLRVSEKRKLRPWNEVSSSKNLFYVKSTRAGAGNIYAVQHGQTKFDANGRVIEKYRLVGLHRMDTIDQIKLDNDLDANRWRQGRKEPDWVQLPSKEEAEAEWERQLAETPPMREREIHLITGVLLPVWDRLDKAYSTNVPRVYRTMTEDGERLLGRRIPPGRLNEVLDSLGAEIRGPEMSPAEAFTGLLRGEISLVLVNDWRLASRSVGNESRIEIGGISPADQEAIEGWGAFSERIGAYYRTFVPTAADGGTVLARILKNHPIRTVNDLGEASLNDVLTKVPGPFDMPVSMEPGPVRQKVGAAQIILGISALMEHPIRTGLFQGKAIGIYKKGPMVARLKRNFQQNLPTVVHEAVGHHLANIFPALLSGLSTAQVAELAELSGVPPSNRRKQVSEGFANFIEVLLTQDTAQKDAPLFYSRFMSQLRTDRELFEKVMTLKELITDYRREGARDRVDQNISQTGRPDRPAGVTRRAWWGNVFRRLYYRFLRAWVYSDEPAARFQRWIEKRLRAQGKQLLPEMMVDKIHLFLTPQALAAEAIEHGIFSISMKDGWHQLSRSLYEVFELIPPNQRRDWGVFNYARQAKEAWEKGVNPGISAADAAWVYEEYKDVPGFLETGERLTAFNNALPEMALASGIVSQNEYDTVIAFWKKYTPLLRILPDPAARGGSLRRGGQYLTLPSPLRRRFGADLKILDPVLATIGRVVQFYNRATQQEAVNAIVRAAEAAGGAGGWVERVSAVKGLRFSLDEIRRQLLDAGISPEELEDIDPETLFWLWRSDYTPRAGGHPVVRVILQGKPQLLVIDKDLWSVAREVNPYVLPWFLNITIGKIQRLIKLGATGLSATFGLRNPVRDYPTFLAQTRSRGLRTFSGPLEGLGRYVYSQTRVLLGHESDPAYRLMEEAGVELHTLIGMDIKRIRVLARDLFGNTQARRLWKVARNPVEAARSLINISEMSSRFYEYRNVLLKHGYTTERLTEMLKQGQRPPPAVLMEAATAANEVTVQFARQGTWARVANQTIPFFSAPIGGIREHVGTWRRQPGRALWAVALMAATAAAYWWRKKDEDWWQEAPVWARIGQWVITNQEGAPIIRIPKGWTWDAVFTTIVTEGLDAIYREEPDRLWAVAAEMVEQVVPPVPLVQGPGDPQVAGLKQLVEVLMNESFFLDRPIVSEYLQQRLPAEQATPWNTRLVKAAGRWMGLPPAKVEYFLDGISGGLFTGLVKPVEGVAFGWENVELHDVPGIKGFTFRSDFSRSTTDFYKLRSATSQAYVSARDRMKQAEAAGKVEPVDWTLRSRYTRLTGMSRLMSDIRSLTKGKKLKRAERFKTGKYLIGLARFGLQRQELARYPNPLVHEDLPEKAQKLTDAWLGSLVYALTQPPLRDNDDRAFTISYAAGLLAELKVEPERLNDLLRLAAAKRGSEPVVSIKGNVTAYGKRKRRLRGFIADQVAD